MWLSRGDQARSPEVQGLLLATTLSSYDLREPQSPRLQNEDNKNEAPFSLREIRK